MPSQAARRRRTKVCRRFDAWCEGAKEETTVQTRVQTTEQTTEHLGPPPQSQFTLENWYVVEYYAWGSQPNGSFAMDEQDGFYIRGKAPAQGGGVGSFGFHVSETVANEASTGQVLTLKSVEDMNEYTFTLGKEHRRSYRCVDPHIIL